MTLRKEGARRAKCEENEKTTGGLAKNPCGSTKCLGIKLAEVRCDSLVPTMTVLSLSHIRQHNVSKFFDL